VKSAEVVVAITYVNGRSSQSPCAQNEPTQLKPRRAERYVASGPEKPSHQNDEKYLPEFTYCAEDNLCKNTQRKKIGIGQVGAIEKQEKNNRDK
jgi:hypothetical protein